MCAVCRGARSSRRSRGRRANRVNWLLHNWWMARGRRKHRNRLLSRLHWDRLHGHGHRHWHVAWHNLLSSWIVIRVDWSRSWCGSDYNTSSSSTTSMRSRWWLWFIDRSWVVAVRAGPILRAERILHPFTLTVRADSLTNKC